MNRARANAWLFWGSILLCYLLQLMPLPEALLPMKPYWMALVLAYWALESPERVSLGLAFVLGLFGDALAGELLGEHAMRLCILCFILLRFRSRLRFLPDVAADPGCARPADQRPHRAAHGPRLRGRSATAAFVLDRAFHRRAGLAVDLSAA